MKPRVIISSLTLDMLEEILGMTEPLKDYLSPEDYERFREICAKTADLREGTEV